MTSKEIASLTGKTHHHVLRDIRSLLTALHGDDPDLDDVSGVVVERDSRGYATSVSLDYEHTLTLLTGYSPLLRKRVVDRWRELEKAAVSSLSPAEQLLHQAQQLVAHEKRLMEVENSYRVLSEAVSETRSTIAELVGGEDYVTIRGFARKKKLRGDRSFLSRLGKQASREAKFRGIRLGEVNDEVWGTVNSYPVSLLEELFGSLD